MKKINIITLITALILSLGLYTQQTNATQLPQPIVNFVKSKYPDATIRFDGLIELSDHTMYLPVLPLTYAKTETPTGIIKTIPANTDFTKKPDMILFANNLALLKLVTINNMLTVNYSPEIPLNVKLGLLPQDLIVPRGLALPTELKVIMGNLRIAIIPKKDKDDLVFFGNPESKNNKNVTFSKKKNNGKNLSELDCIKHKAVYAANFKENLINLIDSDTGRINKTMKLPSIPSNIALTHDCRYLLVTSSALNKLYVIDTISEIFLKEIEVGKYPKSILIPEHSNKAYIANRFSSSISEIELDNMILNKEINIIGNPENLTFNENNKNILYNDTISGNIYTLDINSGISKKIAQVDNISKINISDYYLFVLSRTSNELLVYDLKTNERIAKIQVGEKPVDIQIPENKKHVYLLSAGSDELNIINTDELKIKNTIKLNSGGFPGSMTILDREKKILITNHDAYELIIFDMIKENITGRIPTSKTVSFLQISK